MNVTKTTTLRRIGPGYSSSDAQTGRLRTKAVIRATRRRRIGPGLEDLAFIGSRFSFLADGPIPTTRYMGAAEALRATAENGRVKDSP